ncbi:metallophosphoesterase family protein [Sorangium sp. So ce1078]|uniref:metallophosphoesterase family protein n=1 Tax=Sorangium sp. So ce1078 TaxID=3133329 RepID=UPI003F61DD73
MRSSTRFIHTADWQLGFRARFIPGDAGALVRNQRFETLREIGNVARETKAEFIVVAGDVFEDHGLRPATLHGAFEAMAEIPAPIYLLPGNHDPFSSDALYRSELWRRECPRHVHLLGSREPVIVREGVALLGCPLFERHTLGDVTEHLTPELGPRDHVRIGVAHGGIKEFLERVAGDGERVHNAIPADRASRARLDYLALGDWHGRLRIDERTWYSGTPEATHFTEKDPGSVLVVEIDAPGAAPRVTPRPVAGLVWESAVRHLDSAADLVGLERHLDGFARKGITLLDLTLTGAIDASTRARLDELVEAARHRFRFLRVHDERLQTVADEADAASLPAEGWLGQAVARLRGPIDGTSEVERAEALRLLLRLYRAAS